MNLNIKCETGAIFKMIARKADTHQIVSESGFFHNLVLDTGLARMSVDTWIDRCCVGTGNSDENPLQTSLDSFLASTTTQATGTTVVTGVNVAEAPFYWFARRIFRFSVGIATGNISEVGLGWGNAQLWDRARVKDSFGNPTTITVLPDEYLDVEAEVRIYPKSSSNSFNLIDKFNNVLSSHLAEIYPIIRAGSVYWNAQKINVSSGTNHTFAVSSSDIDSNPSNGVSRSFSSSASIIFPTATTGKISKKLSGAEANLSHKALQFAIGGMMSDVGVGSGATSLNLTCGFKVRITPPITKPADSSLEHSLVISWGRYEPT